MPEGYAIQAIQAVLSGQRAYCKFLAANDTGLTGGHQAGIYISKPSIPILISPESTPEQIEAIFASMAKHLYGAGN